MAHAAVIRPSMAECLGEVAEELPSLWIHLLRLQADIVHEAADALEGRAGAVRHLR